VFAIVLVQAQPDPPSKSGKWCFDRGQDTLLCEETEAECAKLRGLNTEIAKSPCRRVESLRFCSGLLTFVLSNVRPELSR
jgi:hypothetical protein